MNPITIAIVYGIMTIVSLGASVGISEVYFGRSERSSNEMMNTSRKEAGLAEARSVALNEAYYLRSKAENDANRKIALKDQQRYLNSRGTSGKRGI